MAVVPGANSNIPTENVVMGVPKKGRLYDRCMKLLAGAGMDHRRVSLFVEFVDYQCTNFQESEKVEMQKEQQKVEQLPCDTSFFYPVCAHHSVPVVDGKRLGAYSSTTALQYLLFCILAPV